MRKISQLLCTIMLVGFATSASATTLSQAREVWVNIANIAEYGEWDDYTFNFDAGTKDELYYIDADGSGLSQLHITTDEESISGQDTIAYTDANGDLSDTIYITTTGNRGYNDNVILMVSLKPDGENGLPEDFEINIKSSGYDFDPGDYTNYDYETDLINVTYDTDDFESAASYGLHVYKPGPNGGDLATVWENPLYTGQTDFTNGEQLLFIDLKLGNIKDSVIPDLNANGAAEVTVTITGLTTSATLNAYAWCGDAEIGEGVNWTNKTYDTGTSSYRIVNNN